MKRLTIFILIVTALYACSNEIPRGVLPPEKMKLVMWDIFKAEEWVSEQPTRNNDTVIMRIDSSYEKYYQKVFAMHHIDKATFARSLRFYQSRPDISAQLLDSIISHGTREKERLTDTTKKTASAAPDSVKFQPLHRDSTIKDTALVRQRIHLLQDSLKRVDRRILTKPRKTN